jgi:hypothetical protein
MSMKGTYKRKFTRAVNHNTHKDFTRNFYRLTGAARQKTAKQKTPEIQQKARKTRTKRNYTPRHTGKNPWRIRQR